MTPDASSSTRADPIRHVVLLMLENHSFDQMLGALREVYPDLDGVDPQHPAVNSAGGVDYPQRPTTERQMRLDPMHEAVNVVRQLAGGNAGFVQDYSDAYPDSIPEERGFIMGYYPAGFLPALHALARDFAVCDRWFASVPGPTYPNRLFALSGTSNGWVTMPGGLGLPLTQKYDQDTLFDRLNEAAVAWKVYFHDFPVSLLLTHQLRPRNAARHFPIEDFFRDAAGPAERFPAFCLVEPRYHGRDENDDHPPHDVMKAQQMIADVYNALRANAQLWASMLLVVVYDEHGGFFDHVSPPSAVPPDDLRPEEFTFDQLGVRVPALLVSPWVGRGVISTVFDHTSLLKYLVQKWSLGPLGARVAADSTNSIGAALHGSGVPRSDTAERIDLTADQLRPPDPALEEETGQSCNALHRAILALGQRLKAEADWEAPRVLSRWARLVEWLRQAWGWVAKWFVAAPDEFEALCVQLPKFLAVQKAKATQELAQTVVNTAVGEPAREQAVQALETITGQDLRRTGDPAGAAQALLDRQP
jgi:phospholipase C